MEEPFDAAAAHVRFSKDCFNRAWDLIDKTDRSAAEDEEMIRLNQASLWHWTQRPDCSDQNLSIGYWQAARIRALLGHGAEAARYAALCLASSDALAPFFRAYAHEAVARAAMVLGDDRVASVHVDQAAALVATVAKAEDRDLVQRDLDELTASMRRRASGVPR